jgi:hypothetical protein
MKRKVTVYFDDGVARATRVTAARTGKPISQVVADALRSHLRLDGIARAGQRSTLTEAEALALAAYERHR